MCKIVSGAACSLPQARSWATGRFNLALDSLALYTNAGFKAKRITEEGLHLKTADLWYLPGSVHQ